MDLLKIGVFLKKLRKEKGLTQEELAEKLNVSNRSVSRWETGSTLPDVSILIDLAEYYEVEIKEIIDGERKSEDMSEEKKEIVDTVVDYTSKDKELILKYIQQYSGIAAVTFITGSLINIFDFSNKLESVSNTLLWITLIMIISIWSLCNGKILEMRKDKVKVKKVMIILLILLICMFMLIFMMLGIL